LVTAIVLFSISTTQTVINIVLGANDIDGVDVPYDALSLADMTLYVINKYVQFFFFSSVRTLMSFPQCHRRRISRTSTCSISARSILTISDLPLLLGLESQCLCDHSPHDPARHL
jgi:hypothetical protein